MKVKVPGAESSTGVKAQDFSLPKGDYAFEIGSVEIKESEKSPCVIHAFSMLVVDGPDDEKTGKTTQGRKFIRRVIQLLPEHDSYNPTDTRAADEIADLCAAADVTYDPDDGYETEDFVGKKVKARLGVRMGKAEDGTPRPENTVNTQKTDDGVLHMWVSDDGKPSKKSYKSSATAGKRR